MTYPTPLPTNFNTTPIGEVAIRNGITVKNGRLNPNGLRFLMERMIQDGFPNTFVGELSKLPYVFEEEVDLPLLKVASQYCFFMGLRITYGQKPSRLWSNAGVGIANRSMRIYKDALSNRPDVFANFSQYEKQLRSFNKDFSAFKRMQPKLSEKEWRAVLQGNAAPVSDWHQQFEELKSSYPLLATQH